MVGVTASGRQILIDWDYLTSKEYLYIDELPSEQRKVIRLSIDGLSVNEIAEKLGISVNTVKTHKKRSFKQLRGKMRGDASVFWLAFFLS
jgi:RNA polymerase sigma-70 factor (ECF subfamily)